MYSGSVEVKDNKKISLIVAAAGSGKRMGLETKKQFLEFNGHPLYMNCILIAETSEIVSEIIIVSSKEDLEMIKNHCEKYKITKLKKIVEGGAERQDSIYNGLKECEGEFIAVQDGARPFMEKSYLEKGYKELLENENLSGIIVGVKVKDTVKVINELGEIVNTPKRETLILAQTPQIFRSEILKNAYEVAKNENFYGTDDSSLVERIVGKVKILDGSYSNIKITTIEDLNYIG